MTEWKAFEDCTRKQLLTTCYALEDQRDRAIQRAERAEAGEKQALAREAESTREAYRLRDRQRDHYETTLGRVRMLRDKWAHGHRDNERQFADELQQAITGDQP